LASSGDGDSPYPADDYGISMASARVCGMWGGDACVLARRSAERDVRSPRPSNSNTVYGGISLVEAHDPAGDGGDIRRADECGPSQSTGTSDNCSGSRTRGGGPDLRARAGRGAP